MLMVPENIPIAVRRFRRQKYNWTVQISEVFARLKSGLFGVSPIKRVKKTKRVIKRSKETHVSDAGEAV
uniref:Uncharacterized protein n=1 Tax=Nelumbo nucifera TaxID=4432 RepID=A0A822Y8X9_NELNU|nr:TPA_asm: hypothetical protein HUJ06_028953 [Nelumbo nucifera]